MATLENPGTMTLGGTFKRSIGRGWHVRKKRDDDPRRVSPKNSSKNFWQTTGNEAQTKKGKNYRRVGLIQNTFSKTPKNLQTLGGRQGVRQQIDVQFENHLKKKERSKGATHKRKEKKSPSQFKDKRGAKCLIRGEGLYHRPRAKYELKSG